MFGGLLIQVALGVGYVIAARCVVKWGKGSSRDILFATLNILALYLFQFFGKDIRLFPTFITYLILVLFQYVTVRLFAMQTGWKAGVAFFTPLIALVLIRYAPTTNLCGNLLPCGSLFIGISYLAFRSSYLVLEVRNSAVKMPSLFEYIGFCFFAPTMSVGPINTYSNHRRGFDGVAPVIPVGRAMLRLLVGLVKFKFLGAVCFQLTYTNLLMDDHYHHWIDLPVAVVFYYLFLYCNFSGFCDAAIGVAGLIGIPVAENFDNPFAARNVKDFWNRWHITLSQYMRDVVFSPLSKYLVRLFGPANANHAVALTILVVFILVGVWHGVGWHFAAFGAVHAIGVICNHYYTIILKKRLGRDGFKAYNENRLIGGIATAATFCFCAASLFLFANTLQEMRQIFSMLR